MIKANKHPMIEWGFKRFNRIFLNIHFNRIYLWKPDCPIPNTKTLFLINHSTWWDPLLIYYLNEQVIQSDGYGMMHEDGLNQFPFFKRIGAFSVNEQSPRHILDSLRYSIEKIDQGKAIWLFPQGKEQHQDLRPLSFMPGAAYITDQSTNISVVLVTMYYSFQETRKPNVYMKISSPLHVQGMKRTHLTSYFEQEMTEQLDQMKREIISLNRNPFISLNKRGK